MPRKYPVKTGFQWKPGNPNLSHRMSTVRARWATSQSARFCKECPSQPLLICRKPLLFYLLLNCVPNCVITPSAMAVAPRCSICSQVRPRWISYVSPSPPHGCIISYQIFVSPIRWQSSDDVETRHEFRSCPVLVYLYQKIGSTLLHRKSTCSKKNQTIWEELSRSFHGCESTLVRVLPLRGRDEVTHGGKSVVPAI
jgi:hypothetical protein